MTAIDRKPTRLSGGVAVAAAVVAFLLSGPYAWVAFGAGGLGVLLVVVGVVSGRHAGVTAGSAALVTGSIAAGLDGVPAPFVLGGAVAALVAWDAGGTAIDLGAQLGRTAETTRLELVHTSSTVLVGVAAAAGSWGLYRVGLGRRPLTGPMLLLIAALCIAVALTVRGE